MSDDAKARLDEMSLADRVTAVATDIESNRDEFRSIGRYELAELLGIYDARQPHGDWAFVWYVEPREVEDIFIRRTRSLFSICSNRRYQLKGSRR